MKDEQKPLPDVIDLPIIDFSNVYSGGSRRTTEANKLIDAFTDVGFCLIANVPGYNQEEIQEAIKWDSGPIY